MSLLPVTKLLKSHTRILVPLGVRHLAQHAEPDRRAAGDERRPPDEFTTGDVVGVELFGELANSPIHALLLWRH